MPVFKNIVGFSALTPTAILPATAQDVGGTAGELSVRMSISGSKQEDARLMLDGFLFNQVGQTGTQRGYFINPASAENVVVQLPTAGTAESPTGGTVVDTVPKDGGNRFTAYLRELCQQEPAGQQCYARVDGCGPANAKQHRQPLRRPGCHWWPDRERPAVVLSGKSVLATRILPSKSLPRRGSGHPGQRLRLRAEHQRSGRGRRMV